MPPDTPAPLLGQSESGNSFLLAAMTSPVHTVQRMPDPDRWEVIYAGEGPFPNEDPRCGELEATVYIEPSGLRVVAHHA